LRFPAPAPVVDEFGLFRKSEITQLSDWLRKIKERSGVEIAVFVPKSLEGREIADFSIQVAEQWKLGRKKEDKALLFVIAPKERKMRFEVGYGLEGEITDAYSRRILDGVVQPRFREGRYAEGIAAALVAVNEKLPLGLDQDTTGISKRRSRPVRDTLHTVFWIIIVLLFVFFRLFGFLPMGGSRYRSGWGGSVGGGGWSGRGGGSSWGGGGGGFGGGGASSSW
jgi:uncharacterized protein